MDEENIVEPLSLTASGEAAVINVIAGDIGGWAIRKGFREDFDDAKWLELFAAAYQHVYDKVADIAGKEYPDSDVLDAVERLRRIAKRHYEMANTTKLMLMVSELSEALEGQRDGGNYDEELADLMIRVMENAHCNGIPIGDIILRKMAVNEDRPHKHGRSF
jgi:NTP pyrophosphatase (non-canonical NTP hydrolase)